MSEEKTAPAASGKQAAKMLGFGGFFAMTASMVMTVYAYPNFASSGLHLIFFLILGGIFWFLPVALVAAEMATVKGWEDGGIYAWVGNTLGKRWGFAALFYQWFQITVGFVTMAFFVLAAISYIVGWDALYNNPLVMFIGVAIIVWVLTLTQLGGTKLTARIAKIGFFGGVLIPAVVLLIGLIAYLATGGVSQLHFDAGGIVPDFTKVSTLVIFASFILAFAGVEASASHVNELKNPGKIYPDGHDRALHPHHRARHAGWSRGCHDHDRGTARRQPLHRRRRGVRQHIRRALPLRMARVRDRVPAGRRRPGRDLVLDRRPSRALLETANEGIIPRSFAKTNKHGISVKTVVVQGVIVTIWDAVLCGSMALAGGSGSSISYLTAVGLTVVIYLVGYVLFFLAYFKLVFKGKDHARVFQIFGGTAGKCIVAGLGLILTVFALIVSFFPPSQLNASSGTVYVITLLVCWVISVAIPFVIYGLRKHWNGGVDHKPPTIPGKKERAAMATAADAPAPVGKHSVPSPAAGTQDAAPADTPQKE